MKKITCNKCGKEFEEGSNWHAKLEMSKKAAPGYENVPGTKFHKKTIDLCFPCSMEVDKVLIGNGFNYIEMYEKFQATKKELEYLKRKR